MLHKIIPSEIDIKHLSLIRQNVVEFMRHVSSKYAIQPGKLLDIAPQQHEGARPFFMQEITVETIDIDPNAQCDFVGDITTYNAHLPSESYDYIVCTEVLEHTLQPFKAVEEMRRLLKPKGYLFVTVPFNFRIHGPLPDCWRFTEHGLRALFAAFEIVELNAIETEERPLMPIHYSLVVRK